MYSAISARFLSMNVSITLFNGGMYGAVVNMRIFIINNILITLFNGGMCDTVMHLA